MPFIFISRDNGELFYTYRKIIAYLRVFFNHSNPATRKTPEGIYLREFCGAGGGGRTRTVSLPTDFESVTSANSITPA